MTFRELHSCSYIRLERITRSNLRLAVELAKQIFPNDTHDGEFWPETAYRDCIKNPEKQWAYYIAKETATDKVIGITGHYIDSDRYLWVGWFGVLPKLRNQGYASAVMASTKSLAKSFGRKKLRLYTLCSNTPAINFYFKRGFKIIGKPRDMGDGPTKLSHIMEVTL